jgi:hypothetical protein
MEEQVGEVWRLEVRQGCEYRNQELLKLVEAGVLTITMIDYELGHSGVGDVGVWWVDVKPP